MSRPARGPAGFRPTARIGARGPHPRSGLRQTLAFLVAVVGVARARAETPAVSPADPTAAREAGGADGASRPSFFRVRWDDGLLYEAGTTRTLPPTGTRWLFPEPTIVSGRLGGRLHLDGAAFVATGDLDAPEPRGEVRRAFLYTAGVVRMQVPIQYRFEFGALRGRGYLDSAWAEVELPWRDLAVRVGQFDEPFSLENTTSSNAITFLEAPQPVRAFVPGTKAGVQLSQGGGGRPVAWSFGYYADTERGDVNDDTRSPARFAGRLTWVPPRLVDEERATMLHTGLALEYISSPSSVRYTARPESLQGPTVLDTGDINAQQTFTDGLELAMRRGPLLLQSEYLGALLSGHAASSFLWGGYVALACMLSGEVRPYDARSGTFGMPDPAAPVAPWEGRWRGALEAAVRYSYLDLSTRRVRGGRDHAVSLGLNWYWSRHLRLMFDYGLTATSGAPHDGTVSVFQTRFQIAY